MDAFSNKKSIRGWKNQVKNIDLFLERENHY